MLGIVQRTPNVREKPELVESLTGLPTRLPWVWHGLSFAVPVVAGDADARRELLTGTLPAVTGSVPTLTGTAGNKVLACPSGTGTGYLDYGHEPTWLYPSGAFTFWLRLAFQGTCPSFAAFCGKAFTLSSFASWVLYTSMANAARLNFDLSISGAARTTGAMSASLPVGAFVNVFGRWRSGGAVTLDVLGDGGKTVVAQKASAGSYTGTIDWSAAPMRLNAADFTVGAAQHVEALCQWTRRLSDTECQRLADDPWGWLSPRREALAVGSQFPAVSPTVPWNIGQITQVG